MAGDSTQGESSKELVRITTLVGASPFCYYPMYSYHGESFTATGKLEDSINDDPVNQLQKEHLVHQEEVLHIFGHYAEGKPIRVWASNTLPWDLNIPMTTSPPPLPNFMQAFVICAERPPLLLSLYDKGEYSADVEDYTRETARLLHWSLLGFCHLDFLVLPCCMTHDELHSMADLEKKVKTEMDVVERYFRSPLLLSEFTFPKLKEATTALVGSTFIPCLLGPESKTAKMWMLLMDTEWTDKISQVIESLHKGDKVCETFSNDERKDDLIIALEAAKRISFSGKVMVEYTSDSIRECLQGLISRIKKDFDVLLQLTHSTISRAGSQGREMDRLQLETTATELQLKKQRIFNMIIDGQHPQLCKYQLLEDQEFLVSFTEFCACHKEEHTSVLHIGDMEYGLPLLYWSVAVSSPKLTHWCLQIMEDTVTKPEDLPESMMSTAIAAILFSTDKDQKFQAKSFLKRMTNFKPKLEASQSLKLALPLPRHILSEERITKLKTHFESGAECYLDDRFLPIPNSLLSVTVTEDAVSVELPSQHWYLALRLLADREVDETDRDGNTLLHIAADKGNLEAITLALKSGASLAKTNKDSLTPYRLAQNRQNALKGSMVTTAIQNLKLHYACRTDDLIEAKTALCFGADVFCKGEKGNVPLHTACEVGSVKTARLLLKLDAKTEEQNAEGSTPLHVACESGQKAIVELLLQSNAAVNTANIDGNVALHLASKTGHTEIAKILLESSDEMLIDIHNSGGFTPLHFACESGHLETAKMLLEKHAHVDEKSSYGYTPLHLACDKGLNQIAELLINQRADVNAVTKTGLTPLKLACQKDDEQGKYPCQYKANVSGKTDVVKLLLEHRHIDITMQASDGRTALHEACLTGDSVVVRLLLKHFQDKDITVQDKYGRTALHEACLTGEDVVVRQLLEHFQNIDITIQDSDGRTAMHEACKAGKPEVLGLLLNHVKDIDINKQDYNDRTVLHDACSSGESLVVRQLLEHFQDIDINKKDNDGRTALHEACAVGKREVVGLLLLHGKDIDINYQDYNDRTALHEACLAGSVVVVKQLLGHFQDINIDIQDNKCRTAVDIARLCSNAIVFLLEKYGTMTP